MKKYEIKKIYLFHIALLFQLFYSTYIYAEKNATIRDKVKESKILDSKVDKLQNKINNLNTQLKKSTQTLRETQTVINNFNKNKSDETKFSPNKGFKIHKISTGIRLQKILLNRLSANKYRYSITLNQVFLIDQKHQIYFGQYRILYKSNNSLKSIPIDPKTGSNRFRLKNTIKLEGTFQTKSNISPGEILAEIKALKNTKNSSTKIYQFVFPKAQLLY